MFYFCDQCNEDIKDHCGWKNDQGTPKWIEVKVSDLINAYF